MTNLEKFIKEDLQREESHIFKVATKMIKRKMKEILPDQFHCVEESTTLSDYFTGYLNAFYDLGMIDLQDMQIHQAYFDSFLNELEEIQAEKDKIENENEDKDGCFGDIFKTDWKVYLEEINFRC